MAGIVELLTNWQGTLQTAGPIVSILLVLIGGILFGLAQIQPAEARGKWNMWALSCLVGGAIVAAIVASATTIEKIAAGLLA
ncbi:MAG: hypothetical protein AB1468_06415 [Candidatus Micrarchaeota archaeon]